MIVLIGSDVKVVIVDSALEQRFRTMKEGRGLMAQQDVKKSKMAVEERFRQTAILGYPHQTS